MSEKTSTIGERFGNHHNPVLRWTVGDEESIHIASALTPCSDGEKNLRRFFSVEDFCEMAGDCSPDTELSDDEWMAILRGMAETADEDCL